MIKIYVVWKYEPIAQKEQVADWDRDERQANLKMRGMHSPASLLRVSEHVIDQDTLDDLRQVRVNVCKNMLANLVDVAKDINADESNILLMRHDIMHRLRIAEKMAQAPAGYIFDEEIDRYLYAVQEGVI